MKKQLIFFKDPQKLSDFELHKALPKTKFYKFIHPQYVKSTQIKFNEVKENVSRKLMQCAQIWCSFFNVVELAFIKHGE
jgi:hypothetical protein